MSNLAHLIEPERQTTVNDKLCKVTKGVFNSTNLQCDFTPFVLQETGREHQYVMQAASSSIYASKFDCSHKNDHTVQEIFPGFYTDD